MSAVQSLFTGAVLNAEARGEPIPTLPFVTSSVSATLEREDKSHVDSVTGLNLRIIGAPQRFVISSDSSHHSDANTAEAEVDSIVRSSAPTIATVTTVTAAIDADATDARAPVAPSLFSVGSSSTGRTDSVPGGFSDVSGSDFLIGGIRTVVDPDSDLQKVYIPQWSATNEFGLDDSPQLLLKEAEAAEAICLWAEVFKFKATEKSLQGEVADLDAQVTAVKLQNDHIVDQVHEVEISSAGLKEKVAACLNSTEYMSALGAAISKAVEKGMQEGLFAGITHGVEGRKLADITAYNPSAKADYLSALQRLQNVNFSLIEELKSNKDATDGSYPPFSRSTRRSRFCFILSFDVSYSWVKKIRENIASHVSALHGVFVPLSEPLSVVALEGTEGGAGVDGETTAVRNINLFSDVSNTELNILE
nr:hypothetical protein [Tanacetum cinerariifolium]